MPPCLRLKQRLVTHIIQCVIERGKSALPEPTKLYLCSFFGVQTPVNHHLRNLSAGHSVAGDNILEHIRGNGATCSTKDDGLYHVFSIPVNQCPVYEET